MISSSSSAISSSKSAVSWPVVGGQVAELLGLGAQYDPPLLVVGGRVGGEVGFVLKSGA